MPDMTLAITPDGLAAMIFDCTQQLIGLSEEDDYDGQLIQSELIEGLVLTVLDVDDDAPVQQEGVIVLDKRRSKEGPGYVTLGDFQAAMKEPDIQLAVDKAREAGFQLDIEAEWIWDMGPGLDIISSLQGTGPYSQSFEGNGILEYVRAKSMTLSLKPLALLEEVKREVMTMNVHKMRERPQLVPVK